MRIRVSFVIFALSVVASVSCAEGWKRQCCRCSFTAA